MLKRTVKVHTAWPDDCRLVTRSSRDELPSDSVVWNPEKSGCFGRKGGNLFVELCVAGFFGALWRVDILHNH